MKKLFWITFSAAISTGLSTELKSQSIQDLDFLIGTWDTKETIYPGTDREYEESGVRTCSYFLDNAFIKCEAKTTVSKSGRKREYAYIINYNDRHHFFAATNFASDFPLHGQFQWHLNEVKNKITFVAPKNVNEDRFFRGTITLETPDRLVWEGWSSKFKEDKEWVYLIREVATKRK